MEAKQTPLIDLLEAVPADARLVVEDGPYSTSFHPVGRLCHEAAAILRERLAQPEQKPEPPPWWPAVENILSEYGLQAIDFVADFKEAMKQAEQERNFCPRCGKRTNDIHTCTPSMKNT